MAVLPNTRLGQLISTAIQSVNGVLDADAIAQITGWGRFGSGKLTKPMSRMRKILNEVCQDIRKENLSLPVGEQRSLAAHDALMAMEIESSPLALIVDALVLRPEIVMPIEIDVLVEASFNWENAMIAKSEPVPTWKIGDSLTETEQELYEGMSEWAAPGLAGVLIAAQKHLPKASMVAYRTVCFGFFAFRWLCCTNRLKGFTV